MTSTLRAMPPVPPGAGWLTYVRCHDDIGWAITPEDAARVGEDAYLHRRFLADFYAGEFPGTFARGARFQPDPRTGEARTSGTCASLAGLESAPDEVAVELAVRRVLLLHAVAFAHGGLPLIYMGDELGLLNDATVSRRPAQGRRQPLDAPAGDGLGGGRAAPRPGDGRGPAVGRAAAADRGAPRDARDPRPGRRRADLDRQRPRLRALPRRRPASGCSCWRTSPPTRSRWR